jgi:hypothetical protein
MIEMATIWALNQVFVTGPHRTRELQNDDWMKAKGAEEYKALRDEVDLDDAIGCWARGLT